ncbi:MAG: hypothetical protein ACRC2T_08075 [Thermoguttaceae bacterium]
MKNKYKCAAMMTWCVLLVMLMIVGCFLFLSCFRKVSIVNMPSIEIVNDGRRDYALVVFFDHPPWSHSRFFVAEYDHTKKKISLGEYSMIFHPFAKSLDTTNTIVLKNIDGKYEVCIDSKSIGNIEFIDDKIIWFPSAF